MKNTLKIILGFFFIACLAVPFFVSASVNSQSLNLLTSISNTLQGILASIRGVSASSSSSSTPSLKIVSLVPLRNYGDNYCSQNLADPNCAEYCSSNVSDGACTGNNSTTSPTMVASGSIILEQGDENVLVAALQRTLAGDGFYASPITGVFDANTQAAVEAIQKSRNLPVTGYVVMPKGSLAAAFAIDGSSSTSTDLFTPIEIGTSGTYVVALQKFLIARGYLKIAKPTTNFGALTEAAIKAFQAKHNILQTGIIDKATFAAMNGAVFSKRAL